METAGEIDVVVVGAGTAGIPAALFAAARGLRTLLVESAARCGGSAGWARELSGAGLAQQERVGIVDSPAQHLEDLVRLTRGTLNPSIASLAVQCAPDTLRWLERCGVRFVGDTPQTPTLHEPYSLARTYWIEGGGAALRAILEREMERALAAPGSTLRLLKDTRLERLVVTEGAVTGVVLRASWGTVEFVVPARHTILCCGGYVGNDQLFEEMHRVPRRLDWGPASHDGTALRVASEAGADTRGVDCLSITYGAVLESERLPSPIAARLDVLATQREPWELTVNQAGRRFVAEDTPSIDTLERALLRQPAMKAWWIFDSVIANEAPPRIRRWYSKCPQEAYNERPGFHSSRDLAELARRAGIDAAALTQTVQQYNHSHRTGVDPLGRRHMPRAIEKPPYFAICMQGAAYLSPAGLEVDRQLRVLDHRGAAIPGLYAAGDAIGSWQTMGDAACSGMLATSALAFGRRLGMLIGNGATAIHDPCLPGAKP